MERARLHVAAFALAWRQYALVLLDQLLDAAGHLVRGRVREAHSQDLTGLYARGEEAQHSVGDGRGLARPRACGQAKV